MANFNKVILVGNLTRDPQVRYTPNGTAIAEFSLAVNRQWKTPEGDSKEDVCFIDVNAFGRTGEVISEYVGKGDPILVEGRLQMQTWQGQDGQKHSKHIVVAESFQFLNRRGGGQGQGDPSDQAGGSRPPRQAPQGQGSPGPAPQGQAPQGQGSPGPAPEQPNPPASQGGSSDSFGGDDIPF